MHRKEGSIHEICSKTAVALTKETRAMDEISVVLKKFGDEQSSLLDQFERLSFELQLNRAILGRSLSAPGVARTHLQGPQPLVQQPVRQGCRGSGFNKVIKKLLKPIFGKKSCKSTGNGGGRKQTPDFKNPKSWRACSRSLRL